MTATPANVAWNTAAGRCTPPTGTVISLSNTRWLTLAWYCASSFGSLLAIAIGPPAISTPRGLAATTRLSFAAIWNPAGITSCTPCPIDIFWPAADAAGAGRGVRGPGEGRGATGGGGAHGSGPGAGGGSSAACPAASAGGGIASAATAGAGGVTGDGATTG